MDLAFGRTFQPGRLNHFSPRPHKSEPAGKLQSRGTPECGQGVRFVVGVICTVMGVVGACALIRRSNTFIFMRMFIQIVGGKRRDVERYRQGSNTMRVRPSDRRKDGPEQDHQQNQPSHARCCPVGAHGA